MQLSKQAVRRGRLHWPMKNGGYMRGEKKGNGGGLRLAWGGTRRVFHYSAHDCIQLDILHACEMLSFFSVPATPNAKTNTSLGNSLLTTSLVNISFGALFCAPVLRIKFTEISKSNTPTLKPTLPWRDPFYFSLRNTFPCCKTLLRRLSTPIDFVVGKVFFLSADH